MDNQNAKRKSFGGHHLDVEIDRSTPEREAETKKQKHFYQRMLRAYLKGKEYFHFGIWYNPITKMKEQKSHEVLINWQ